MRCFYFSPILLITWTAMLSSGSAQQQPDPTRLGEGVRPLPGSRVLNKTNSDELGVVDENDFAPESPGDDDLGQQLILKNAEKDRWLNAQADTFLFWTDNPANLSQGGDEDVFWGGQVSLGAQPRLAERLYLDAYLSQQIYRYDESSYLDYEYLQTSLGLIYVEPRLADSVLFVQGQFGRTTIDDFSDGVLNSYSILAGIQKTVLFDRRNSLYMNLMGDWDVDTDVSDLKHAEYTTDLIYRYKIMRDLVLSASYRFTWFDYYNSGRSDALNILGLQLNYSPYKWMSIYAGCTYNINDSDIETFDYETANLGGGVGVLIRF